MDTLSGQFGGIVLFIFLLAIYGYVYKIPMMCYGCEKPDAFTAMFFKCIVDTSEGSEMCVISQRIDKIPEDITETGKKISGAIIQELGSKLPDSIKIAYENVMIEIKKIIKIIRDNIDSFNEKLKGFINDAYLKVKDMVIKTYDEFYALLILPILEFMQNNIAAPVLAAVQLLSDFKDLISKSITESYESITGQILKLKNTLVNAIGEIPKSIEEFINALIDAINFATERTIDGGNDAINTVVGGTNKGIQGMVDTANLATGGIVDVSKKAITGIQGEVNKSIGFINENAIDKINILIGPGITDLKSLLNSKLVDPLNSATKTISDTTGNVVNPIVNAINDVIDFRIPSIVLPQINIPEANIVVAKIPGWTLLKETKLTEDIKILPNVTRIPRPNLTIGDIPAITFKNPDPLAKIGGVNIPVNFDIAKIGPPPGNSEGTYINVKKDLIPKPDNINGGTPRTQEKNMFNMKKGGFLPQIDLDPAVDAIKNELNKPINFFNEKIQAVYDITMAPINDMIVTLIAAYESIRGAISILFDKYINLEFIKTITNELSRTGGIIIEKALGIINELIIAPVLSIINTIKESIMVSVNKIIEIVQDMFVVVGKALGDMFAIISDVLYEATRMLTKGGYYFLMFSLVKWLDTIIPLDISKGAKLNLYIIWMLTIAYVFFYSYILGFYAISPYALVAVIAIVAPTYVYRWFPQDVPALPIVDEIKMIELPVETPKVTELQTS